MSDAAAAVLRAAVLGALQGATEFLPVSSSGHLIVVPELLRWPPPTIAFHVTVHVATMLAVIAYFRRDWLHLVRGAVRGLGAGAPWRDPDGRLLTLLVAASIPAAAAGLALKEPMERALSQTSRSAALGASAMLLVTSALLLISDRAAARRVASPRPAPEAEVTWRQALTVGLAQACAILPGISRSGATISAGLLGGMTRAEATRFSFLLSTPIVFGASLVEVGDLIASPPSASELAPLAVGMLASGVTGYAVIAWLLGYVRRRSLRPFAAYTAAAGLVFLLILARR